MVNSSVVMADCSWQSADCSVAICHLPHRDLPANFLVVGIEANPAQLDPRYATDANAVRIGNLIYNSLLRTDQNLRLQPELAASWQRIDRQTFQFDLRPNIKFHDGRPLTAADVKYTFESVLDPAHRSPKRALLKQLQSIELDGSHRLRFHLNSPHAPFVEHFTLGIVPQGSPPNSRPPPGSGPFMLETIEPGESVTLKSNPNYWESKPALAGVRFKIVPDAMVRALEFKQGAIDFMQNDLEPDMLPWLRKLANTEVSAHQGTTFQYLGINLTHPILRRLKVRQALAHAIDRERIIRHLLKGSAIAANGLISPLNDAYDREIGLDANGPMTVEGVTATFEEMRAGIEEGGKRLIWIGNRRIGNIEVQEQKWTTTAKFEPGKLSTGTAWQVCGNQALRWSGGNCPRGRFFRRPAEQA